MKLFGERTFSSFWIKLQLQSDREERREVSKLTCWRSVRAHKCAPSDMRVWCCVLAGGETETSRFWTRKFHAFPPHPVAKRMRKALAAYHRPRPLHCPTTWPDSANKSLLAPPLATSLQSHAASATQKNNCQHFLARAELWA